MKVFKNHNIILFISTILVLCMVSSCRSAKNAITVGGEVVEKTDKELLTDVVDKELKYKTISGKAKFELAPKDSKRSLKVNAVVKIVKDETIQLSLRAVLGLEMALVTLTPDSIYIIDRYNKKYGSDGISKYAKSNSSFNYYNLQSLLTNTVFAPGETSLNDGNYNKFSVSTNSNMYLLKAKDKSNVVYNFAVGGDAKLVSTLVYSPGKFTMQWSYANFIKDGSYIYPTEMNANMEIRNQRIDTKISYDKLEIDQDVKIADPTPNSYNYQRATISDIIKQYMRL